MFLSKRADGGENSRRATGNRNQNEDGMKKNIISLCVALCLGLPVVTTFVGCAGDRYERSTGQYIDDKALVMRVKGALGDNPEYKFESVNVDSFRGTVQLSGFVNTSSQKAEAARIAKNVQGVQDVENNITLKP
jgi:hyperosmotically inducible periplasmic protein